MTDNELILALSDMLDKKIEPLKKEMVTFKQEVRQDMAEFKREVRQDMAEFKQEVRQDMAEFKQEVRQDMAEFKQEMQHELTGVKQDIVSVKLNIENKITPKIDLLVENYVPAARQYVAKANEIEAMKNDIILLRKVVTEHSKKLQEIG